MSAYYNEHDPYAAQWLRNLIAAGHIAPGDVDERSIEDVQPDDVRGYTQCHFFAGIGGWSYALRLAGWPDHRPVWTGSCPCQPFSAAGKGAGFGDSRHLWPAWFRLIRECAPPVVFGEQVASAAGLGWFDTVSTDLEDAAYAIGAADLCAAGVGAPHIRQRLWFVADAERRAAERRGYDVAGAAGRAQGEARERQRVRDDAGDGGELGELADAEGGDRGLPIRQRGPQQEGAEPLWRGKVGDVGDSDSATTARLGRLRVPVEPEQEARRSGHASAWQNCELVPCADGKARPVEPGTFPLAHGVSGRVGRLRGYGNAIVPQVAAEFIGAYLDVTERGDE